jgi:hypothetical protein
MLHSRRLFGIPHRCRIAFTDVSDGKPTRLPSSSIRMSWHRQSLIHERRSLRFQRPPGDRRPAQPQDFIRHPAACHRMRVQRRRMASRRQSDQASHRTIACMQEFAMRIMLQPGLLHNFTRSFSGARPRDLPCSMIASSHATHRPGLASNDPQTGITPAGHRSEERFH